MRGTHESNALDHACRSTAHGKLTDRFTVHRSISPTGSTAIDCDRLQGCSDECPSIFTRAHWAGTEFDGVTETGNLIAVESSVDRRRNGVGVKLERQLPNHRDRAGAVDARPGLADTLTDVPD